MTKDNSLKSLEKKVAGSSSFNEGMLFVEYRIILEAINTNLYRTPPEEIEQTKEKARQAYEKMKEIATRRREPGLLGKYSTILSEILAYQKQQAAYQNL